MRIDETSATAPAREQRLTGIGVSPGIAIGPAYLGDRGELPVSETRIAESAIDSERDRFGEAVATSIKQLPRLKTRPAALPGSAPPATGYLPDAPLAMLPNSRLLPSCLH